MLIAAPKILGEMKTIKEEESSPIVFSSDFVLSSDYSKILPVTKLVFWFKITDEMLEDSDCMGRMVNDKHSFLWKRASEAGINLDKPFNFTVGFEADDFNSNIQTAIIEQYIPV